MPPTPEQLAQEAMDYPDSEVWWDGLSLEEAEKLSVAFERSFENELGGMIEGTRDDAALGRELRRRWETFRDDACNKTR